MGISRKVLFARLSPAAHSWAMQKVKTSKEKGLTLSTVVERLLLNDKTKVTGNRAARAAKKQGGAQASANA